MLTTRVSRQGTCIHVCTVLALAALEARGAPRPQKSCAAPSHPRTALLSWTRAAIPPGIQSTALDGAAITGPAPMQMDQPAQRLPTGSCPIIEGCCTYRLGADLRATSSGAILPLLVPVMRGTCAWRCRSTLPKVPMPCFSSSSSTAAGCPSQLV